MHLHLYIPLKLAHPTGVTQGTIISLIKTLWNTNTQYTDFIHHATKLYTNFAKRGYSTTALNTHFKAACDRLINPNNHNTKTPNQRTPDYRRQLFFHMPYHPTVITRIDIQKVYNARINNILHNRQLTVAISRPCNLKDKLC